MIYVKDIMTRDVKTISSDASIIDAAKAMVRWKIGSLVITRSKEPIGIITEGDISKAVAKGLDPAKASVSQQRKKLITVGLGEPVEVAAKIMAAAGVKKLPVLDEGNLIGMITQTDIVGSSFSLVTSLKEMVQARYRPPDFEL